MSLKEYIEGGSMVFFDLDQKDRRESARVQRWIEQYGSGPFLVYKRFGDSLALHKDGKPMNFGPGQGVMISIAYVKIHDAVRTPE